MKNPNSLLSPSRFSDFLPLGDVGAAVGGFVGRVGGALLGRASPKTGAPAAPTYSLGCETVFDARCHQGEKPWVYTYNIYIWLYSPNLKMKECRSWKIGNHHEIIFQRDGHLPTTNFEVFNGKLHTFLKRLSYIVKTDCMDQRNLVGGGYIITGLSIHF